MFYHRARRFPLVNLILIWIFIGRAREMEKRAHKIIFEHEKQPFNNRCDAIHSDNALAIFFWALLCGSFIGLFELTFVCGRQCYHLFRRKTNCSLYRLQLRLRLRLRTEIAITNADRNLKLRLCSCDYDCNCDRRYNL